MINPSSDKKIFEKLIRDGKVAVLYSPGYGAGWYSWNDKKHEGLLFDRELVELVLANKQKEAGELAYKKYHNVSIGGAYDLDVEWVPQGCRFEIVEYDGYESVRIFKPDDGIVA